MANITLSIEDALLQFSEKSAMTHVLTWPPAR